MGIGPGSIAPGVGIGVWCVGGRFVAEVGEEGGEGRDAG